MKPTDEQINRCMAEVLGYHVKFSFGEKDDVTDYYVLHKPDKTPYTPSFAVWEFDAYQETDAGAWGNVPNFCNDRNTLPEIWNELERDGRPIQAWNYFIHFLLPRRRVSLRGAWYILQSSPRRQVIAALKALNEWPDEWEGSE